MKNMMRHTLAAALLTLAAPSFAAVPQPADTAPTGPEASIPFVRARGIYDFEPTGRDDAVYLQDEAMRWYYARLLAPCIDLPFVEAIGVDTTGPDTLDRYGTLIVRGQRCPLQSLVRSGPPPRKEKKARD